MDGSTYQGQAMCAPSPSYTKEAVPPDPWAHRSAGMRCRTCMFWVKKVRTDDPAPPTQRGYLGRCRRHAPTTGGFPAVFDSDWCGDHKLDENK